MSNKRLSMILYFLWEHQCKKTQAYYLKYSDYIVWVWSSNTFNLLIALLIILPLFVGPSVPEDTGLPSVILWLRPGVETHSMFLHLLISRFSDPLQRLFPAPKPTTSVQTILPIFCVNISTRRHRLTVCNTLTIVVVGVVGSYNTLNLPAPIHI